jgi:PAS domain S-box-containing protein
MHAPTRPSLRRSTLPRDTTVAGVLRDLNAKALKAARWGGPVSAVAYAALFVSTGDRAFGALAALAVALGVVSADRLKRGRHDAEFMLMVSGIIVAVASTVIGTTGRWILPAAFIVLAMVGFLLLPSGGRLRSMITLTVLMCSLFAWYAADGAPASQVLTHLALTGGFLAVGLVAMGLARSAIERSERLRLEVFRRVPIGLVRVSRSGTLIEANPAFATMLGYEPHELIGGPIARVYEDPGPLVQLANRLGTSEGALRYAHRLRRRDGSTMWVRGNVQAVRDESGSLVYFEGAVEDVTQRREIEERSRVNAERFRNVFERAPIAIWEEDWSAVARRLAELREEGVTDLAGHLETHPDEFIRLYEGVRYLDVNPAGMDLVSATTKKEAFANTRPPPPPSPIAASFIKEFVAIWEGHDHMTLEAHGNRVDGEPLNLSISWAAARDAEGDLDLSHVIVAMVDITSVKRAERELAALVESKDELVASVSHELRTPITTILGMAFELRDNATDFSRDEADELIGLIADQSRELSNIVEDLLVAARSDVETLVIRPESLRVGDELDQIVASTAPGMAPRIEVLHEATAWADPLRFRQIMRNLLSNARRYGGPDVRIGVTGTEDEVVVTVSDDGPGVQVEDHESIFLPYVRSVRDAALPGSIGLGLPVSRRLARLMGGDLTYRYDTGSVFELRLPAVSDRVLAV